MRALPSGPWQAADPGLASAPVASDWEPVGRIDHVFTHFSLDLAIVTAPEPVGDGWWHPVDRLAEAGLPTLYVKAVNAALGAPLLNAGPDLMKNQSPLKGVANFHCQLGAAERGLHDR
jgi:hypothetical protein